MDTLSYRTKHANAGNVKREWYVIDAEDKVLGRIASKIAMILMGKNKPSYTAHCDTGDFVIVLNAGKVKLTGKKMDQKEVIHHTGYPGGQRSEIARDLLERIRVPVHATEFALTEPSKLTARIACGRAGQGISRHLH